MSKAGKWTDAEAKAVAEAYNGGEGKTVEEIAEDTGRATRSVQGKLTSLNVYVKPEKAVAKPKDDGPTKKAILADIAATGFDIEGGDGATKGFLTRVLDTRSVPKVANG